MLTGGPGRSEIGVGMVVGRDSSSSLLDLFVFLKMPLNMFSRNPFFASLTVGTLFSLFIVVIDPRETGLTSTISISICAGVVPDAGTMESNVMPYSCIEGFEGITTNRRFGSGFDAFRIGMGNPFACACRTSREFCC
jgi:hypothetical protein